MQKTPESRSGVRARQDGGSAPERHTHLHPAAVPADHLRVGHGGEERVGLQVLRQAAEELSDVDEIHLQQNVLEQAENPQRRPKERLLAIATEHVPNAARHVQGEGLAVEREDPAKQGFHNVSIHPSIPSFIHTQFWSRSQLSGGRGGASLDGPAYHRAQTQRRGQPRRASLSQASLSWDGGRNPQVPGRRCKLIGAPDLPALRRQHQPAPVYPLKEQPPWSRDHHRPI